MSSVSKREDKEEKLLQASRSGDLSTVLSLLQIKSPKSGASVVNVNCKGKSKSNQGWTPLHLAAYFGHKDVVEALLKHNADVNAVNGMGDTALHRAAFTGRPDVVTLLIQYNADVLIINGEGRKPSQVTNNSEVKRLIRAVERSLQLKLEERLLTAAREGDTSELKKLITGSPHPPNINCQDSVGNTPLHCAAYRGHKSVAVILLQHGADTLVRNNSGKTAVELASNKKMKQLLGVQPLQKLHKVAPRHEGYLMKRSRFFGWKKFWVVLERGVLTYFNMRADAAVDLKRQGYKYLDHCKFSVTKEEKYKIKIHYSDNTVHIWSIPPHEKAPKVQRQRWLNSLHEHCAYSTHFTTQPTLLTADDQDEDVVPLGSMHDSLKSARAHQQLLDELVTVANNLIASITGSPRQSNTRGGLSKISEKLNEVVSTARSMCSALTHCLDLLSQQEEVRELRLEKEKEKIRFYEDALHVLAMENLAMEESRMRENLYGSRMTITSDANDEFFDALSTMEYSTTEDFPADEDDSDDGDEYIPSLKPEPSISESSSNEGDPNHIDELLEPSVNIKRSVSGDKLQSLKRQSLVRSNSDNNIVAKSNLLPNDSLHKSKSASSEMEQNALLRKQEAENQTQGVSKYRLSLPTAMVSRNEFSVWTVLKQCIGKDLSRITMPVIFNEPLTFLQRFSEYMEYVYLLHKAASLDDALERMQYVCAFAISATASTFDRVGKPFNPLLGETFELVREDMGFKLVAEQVSHHPPVSAMQCESDGFVFHVTVQPKLKFWGKGVEVQPKGMVTLTFPKHKEVYTWNNVNSCVHNIIVGQLWIEQYGQMEITNHSTGDFSVINFKPCGWFGKDVNKVEGAIFSANKRKRFVLKGDWSDSIHCFAVEGNGKKSHSRWGSIRRPSNISEASSTSAASLDSYSSSGSDGSVTVDPSAPRTLWTVNTRPANSKQMYNFTTFAMQVNELHEGLRSKLPPTDSKLRPDCRALENGDLELATREKIRLEEKQRSSRRERQKKNERWIPRWFSEDLNPYTQQMDWIYKGNYWERDFTDSPDIF